MRNDGEPENPKAIVVGEQVVDTSLTGLFGDNVIVVLAELPNGAVDESRFGVVDLE